MSTEQLTSPLHVTKYDVTERLKPGWPHHFHYEAKKDGVEFSVGYVSLRHWLDVSRVEIDDISVDNSGGYESGQAMAVGKYLLQACAHDLQKQGLTEVRLSEPSGVEFALVKDVFGEDGFDVTTYQRSYWPAPSERQLIQLPADELLDRCLRAQDHYDPTDEALDLWIPLNQPNIPNWPTSEVYPQPVYL